MTVHAIAAASVLLLLGFSVRRLIRPLRSVMIPASIIGGLLGLVMIQVARHATVDGESTQRVCTWMDSVAGELSHWPGALIAVVFAGLLLEHPARGAGKTFRSVLSAGIMVWLIIIGQMVLGIAAVFLLRQSGLPMPPSFGQLIEAGFAGGHGTAAAIGGVYESLLGSSDGRDLAMFMATAGLVMSVLVGIVLVNVGVRRGWSNAPASALIESTDTPALSIGKAMVRSDILNPLALQVAILAMAIVVGWVLQQGFIVVVDQFGDPEAAASSPLKNVPLFLFTLIGGLVVRKVFTLVGVGELIDTATIRNLVGISMDFLIVAAIASIRIETIVSYAVPLIVLLGVGLAWCVLCLVVVSPRILPRAYWFELALINFGMSTGTTAQGMMLLRIVDRDLDTPAAEDYAMAAPLSAPLIGGGLLTLSLPVMLERGSTALVLAGLVALWVVLLVVGLRLRR